MSDDRIKPLPHREPEELAEFAAALEALRRRRHLTYRSLSTTTGYSSSVLSKAASGSERPTLEVVRAFVAACGDDVPIWTDRWATMTAAVERHQRDLRAMTDSPYELLTCPSSPARFNRQLQLRVCRDHKQAAAAVRANYAPSTASGVFKGNRLANEEFVRRMLAAAGAPEHEQAVWLKWRRELSQEPQPAVRSVANEAPAQRSSGRRRAGIRLVPAIVPGICVILISMASLQLDNPPAPVHPDARSSSSNVRPQPRPTNIPPDNTAPTPHSTAAVPRVVDGKNSRQPGPGSALPNTTTPEEIRRWPAKVVRNRASTDGPHVDVYPVRPGQTIYIVCFTTKTEPKGWYYTDNGYYVDPAIVRFSGDDQSAVPPCDEVSFPEAGK